MASAPFSQLQAFLIVARTTSFSAAARELGVSRSAVSQSVAQLERQLGVALLVRTTRSTGLTDAGRRLVEAAGPAVAQIGDALASVSIAPGEPSGRLRLSVPRSAVPLVIEPVLPAFRARHPGIEVEIVADDRFVDIVASGFDAGVRLDEAIERDMVRVRLTEPFRFVVVGAPAYLAAHGAPQRPEDLASHECITFRAASTGVPYAWELERGRRTWRIAVRGGVIASDSAISGAFARAGLGLAYVLEPTVRAALARRELRIVLEPYAPEVPGFFLYYPSRSQRSELLRLFVEVARQTLRHGKP